MKTNIETDEYITALAEFLSIQSDEITELDHDHYGLRLFSADGGEYAIGTDSEADAACETYVENSIWAFNADFIVSQCDLPHQLAEAIQAWQEKDCESANDGLSALVAKLCGIPDFTQAAISADGRGHFLSSYDGEENEQGEFYIYCTN